MIQLFINSLPAVVKDGTSFKVSLENQFFTKTSSYSFDVELPMSAPENRAIFGNLNRRDVTKGHKSLTAKLLADNITILSGTATITQVTEASVKVQLLGESAAYRYGNKVDKLHIDTLPLGDWYTRTFGTYPGFSQSHTGSTYPIISYLAYELEGDWTATSFINWILHNGMWVAYPIYNTEADTVCNHYLWRATSTDDNAAYYLSVPYATPDGSRNGHPQIKFAVQPFLWYMCKIIAEATGYTLADTDNALYQDPFLRRIFLANANINIECNRCLPHWTVNEWWTQIENTFGVTMLLSDTDRSMRLVTRSAHLSTSPITLTHIVDSFTTEINDDPARPDITTQNVAFATSDQWSLQQHLSDEILDLATIVECDTLTNIKTHLADDDAFRKIYQCHGRQYVLSNRITDSDIYRIREVNLLRPRRVTDNDNNDVELKFIPCAFTNVEAKIVTRFSDDIGPTDGLLGKIDVTMLSRPDRTNFDWFTDESTLTDTATFNLNSIIFGSDTPPEEEETHDIAYIAIHPGEPLNTYTHDQYGNLTYPHAHLNQWKEIIYNGDDIIETTHDPDESLSLIPIDSQHNLATHLFDTTGTPTAPIDTTVRHCFHFIADKIPNTSDVFVINNKKYLCEKLEVSINSKGIDKLITGYFYLIN